MTTGSFAPRQRSILQKSPICIALSLPCNSPDLCFLRVEALNKPSWSPNRCLQSLHSVCSFLTKNVLPTDPLVTYPHIRGNRQAVKEAGGLPPAVVWRLAFDPKKGCELHIVGEVGLVDGRWGGMLKEEYVRWRMGLE